MLIEKVKLILLMMITIIYTDSHTHFMEQAFNKPYPSMEYKCTTKEIQ